MHIYKTGSLTAQYNSARVYTGMGKDNYERAIELLQQGVGIQEKSLAPDDPEPLVSQQLLEALHRRIEAKKDAESSSASGETV